jgi:hypothetical protein
MTPNGNLTVEKVQLMIYDAIDRYDGVNTQRHNEHTRQMNRLLWAIMATFATVAGALSLEIVRFMMGK